MPFDKTQEELVSYMKGYVAIGLFVALGGVFLIAYAFMLSSGTKKERERKKKRDERRMDGVRVAAGLKEENSYIKVNGKLIEQKKRIV